MKKFAILFVISLVLLGCFIPASCALSVEEPAADISQSEATYTEATVFAKCGEIVQISAPANPSTGYTWMISHVSPGLDVLVDPMTSISTGFVGSNGVYQCWVSADAPGFYLFNAEYARAWGEEPIMTLKTLFVYLPDFLNGPSGMVSIRDV